MTDYLVMLKTRGKDKSDVRHCIEEQLDINDYSLTGVYAMDELPLVDDSGTEVYAINIAAPDNISYVYNTVEDNVITAQSTSAPSTENIEKIRNISYVAALPLYKMTLQVVFENGSIIENHIYYKPEQRTDILNDVIKIKERFQEIQGSTPFIATPIICWGNCIFNITKSIAITFYDSYDRCKDGCLL